MLSGSSSVGQSFSQLQALVQGFGWSVVRPTVAPKFEAESSFGAQRSQARTQTRIFAMSVGKAQTNPNTMIGTMLVFGTSAQVLFNSRLSRSFISSPFALHVD